MSDGTTNAAAADTAAAAATTAATTAAPANGASAASAIKWLPTADETTAGYIQNKGWQDDPGKVVEGYRNLEKLLGAEKANRTVVLPGDNATPEELAAFRSKLGVPADSKGYNIPLPDGTDTAFADTAKGWFHEAGLTPKQAEAVAQKWTEYMTEGQASVVKAKSDKAAAEAVALDAEWGAARGQNVDLAQRTRKALGVSDAEVDSIAEVIGLKRTVQMFHKLGTRTGEADFIEGTSAAGNVMTPGQAKSKIAELRTDKAWVTRYTQGGLAEKHELALLSALASPETRR